MLNGAMPIFTAVIASVMLRRLPKGAQLLGLVVGFGGVIAISAPSLGEGESQALGVALVVLATLFYGFAVNIAAPLQQKYGSLPVMSRMLVLATLWTTPYGVFGLTNSSFAWESLAAVAAVGVLGTGVAFVVIRNTRRASRTNQGLFYHLRHTGCRPRTRRDIPRRDCRACRHRRRRPRDHRCHPRFSTGALRIGRCRRPERGDYGAGAVEGEE